MKIINKMHFSLITQLSYQTRVKSDKTFQQVSQRIGLVSNFTHLFKIFFKAWGKKAMDRHESLKFKKKEKKTVHKCLEDKKKKKKDGNQNKHTDRGTTKYP